MSQRRFLSFSFPSVDARGCALALPWILALAACSSSPSTPAPSGASGSASGASAATGTTGATGNSGAAGNTAATGTSGTGGSSGTGDGGTTPCTPDNVAGTWEAVGEPGGVTAISTITSDGQYTLRLYAAAPTAGTYYETEETGSFTIDQGIVTAVPIESTCSASDPARIGACVLLENGDIVAEVFGGSASAWAPYNQPLLDAGEVSTGCLVSGQWVASPLAAVP